MKVLVTGARGFIGSHLVRAYVERGDHVIAMDNGVCPVVDGAKLAADSYDSPGTLSLIHRDAARLADDEAVRVFRPDVVVHCAAPVGPVGVLRWKGTIVPEIVGATQGAVAVALAAACPLINVSTSEVYGFSGTYHEDDTLAVPPLISPRMEYAVGKLAAEWMVRSTPGLLSVTIRPFNIAGDGQDRAKGFVLPTFVEQTLAGESLTVFGSGRQERCLTAVDDLVAFVLDHALDARLLGGVVNVGNPANRTTVLELARTVLDVLDPVKRRREHRLDFTTGKSVHGDEYEEAAGTVKVANIERAMSVGWKPRVGLRDLVRRVASSKGWLP